jgi:hypothetical protein
MSLGAGWRKRGSDPAFSWAASLYVFSRVQSELTANLADVELGCPRAHAPNSSAPPAISIHFVLGAEVHGAFWGFSAQGGPDGDRCVAGSLDVNVLSDGGDRGDAVSESQTKKLDGPLHLADAKWRGSTMNRETATDLLASERSSIAR